MDKKKVFISLIIAIIIIILTIIGCFLSKEMKSKKDVNETIITKENKTDKIEDKILDDNVIDTNSEKVTEPTTNKAEQKVESNNTTTSKKVINITQKEATTKQDIPSKFELHNLGNLQYYLYIPSNPEANMPLIMYLHGGTNKKGNVETLLTTDGFPKYLYDGYYNNLRSYVVIPKLTNSYTGWVDISDNLKTLIKTLNTSYAIDLNKVSLTGHSMGGTGTYQLQIKLPNTFACIAPMSGSIKNTEENLTGLSKTKIWAFIGTNDTIVDPSSSRTIIATLKSIGVNAKITELEGTDHFGVPSKAYKNNELISWLVNCKK